MSERGMSKRASYVSLCALENKSFISTCSDKAKASSFSRTAAQQHLAECVVEQRLAASRRARSTN